MVVGIHHADHVARSIIKRLPLTSPTSAGRSVGIVRSRTQATEFSLGLAADRTTSIHTGAWNQEGTEEKQTERTVLPNVTLDVSVHSAGANRRSHNGHQCVYISGSNILKSGNVFYLQP
jgi:hypothetical protein